VQIIGEEVIGEEVIKGREADGRPIIRYIYLAFNFLVKLTFS
jgi:hypothetical protein